MRGLIAIAFLCAFIGSAEAHSRHHVYVAHDMVHGLGYGFWHMKQSADRNLAHHHHAYHHRARHHYRHSDMPPQHYAMWGAPFFMTAIGDTVRHAIRSIEPHPAGCPRTQFCGCGVSERVFGRPVRNLYLAANWYRFPRGAPVPGNVIVRQHHVKYIESVQNGELICYDPNSGGHLTRLQPCGSGGTIVNPRG